MPLRSTSSRTPLVPVGVLALWAVGAPPAAAVTLHATVSGTQTTRWTYVKEQAPTCDWPEREEGEQTITLHAGAPQKIKVRVGAGGALRFSGAALDIRASARLRRSFDRRYSEQAACADGAPAGRELPAVDEQGTATCDATGAVRLRFATSRKQLYPAGDPRLDQRLTPPLRAGSALLLGEPAWPAAGSWPYLPAQCSDLGQPNADIGLPDGQGEWAGGLIESRAALPVRALLTRGRRTRTVRVRANVDYPNAAQPTPGAAGTTGRTTLDLRLTLSR